MDGLSLESLESLLSNEEVDSVTRVHNAPQQFGPLRQFEKPMKCMDGNKQYRCGSQTHFKVQGTPKCMIHALRQLNVMLQELGVEK